MSKFIGPIIYKASMAIFGEAAVYHILAIAGIIFAVIFALSILIDIVVNKSNVPNKKNTKTSNGFEYQNHQSAESSTSYSGPFVFILIICIPTVFLVLYCYLF